MTDDSTEQAARKHLAEQREESDRTRKEAAERMTKSKPTPTQEENDLAALGVHIMEKEDDGSGPDVIEARQITPNVPSARAGYRTRTTEPRGSRE